MSLTQKLRRKKGLEGKIEEEEISEKDFLKAINILKDYYTRLYVGMNNILEQIKYYKSLGYGIKYYVKDGEYKFELTKEKKIGFGR